MLVVEVWVAGFLSEVGGSSLEENWFVGFLDEDERGDGTSGRLKGVSGLLESAQDFTHHYRNHPKDPTPANILAQRSTSNRTNDRPQKWSGS